MRNLVYSDNLKIKDALDLYFSKYHFENGGYHLKWFRIKVGSVFIPLPNIKARVDAVKFHDVHHLLTEYPATLKGEAEIGAWEIASGCGKYYVAWVLNFGSLTYGLFFFPKSLFTAFLNGRKCKTNLYHNIRYDENLLNRTVGELRHLIGINDARRDTAIDYLYFIICCLLTFTAAFFFFYFFYIVVRLIANTIK